MVGTIFGVPLSQLIANDGEPVVGAKLYLYEAGTSTPVTPYEDYGLTTGLERPNPMVADAVGRIPSFWLADGSYRVRLTDADGLEIYDISSITAIGASSGAATGGGTSSESVFAVGDMIFTFGTSARTGWVRANGKTIGPSSSGATERAGADTEDLFAFLWNNVSDTYAAVSGGRGASSATDWSANKTIVVPTMRGRSPVGMDEMGNIAAGILVGVTDPGETGGETSFTIPEGALPSHTHGPGTLTVADHTHTAGDIVQAAHTHDAGTFAVDTFAEKKVQSGTDADVSDADPEINQGQVTGTSGSAQPDITGTTGASGSSVESGATSSVGSNQAGPFSYRVLSLWGSSNITPIFLSSNGKQLFH